MLTRDFRYHKDVTLEDIVVGLEGLAKGHQDEVVYLEEDHYTFRHIRVNRDDEQAPHFVLQTGQKVFIGEEDMMSVTDEETVLEGFTVEDVVGPLIQ